MIILKQWSIKFWHHLSFYRQTRVPCNNSNITTLGHKLAQTDHTKSIEKGLAWNFCEIRSVFSQINVQICFAPLQLFIDSLLLTMTLNDIKKLKIENIRIFIQYDNRTTRCWAFITKEKRIQNPAKKSLHISENFENRSISSQIIV